MALRLTDFHVIAQARIRRIVRLAVSRLWRALGSYDEPDVPIFLNEVVPVVFAAQERSIALTDAYLARMLDRPPLGIDPAPISGSDLRGVDEQTEWRRPFIEVWSQLQKQTDWQEAVGFGETRAVTLAETDVQLSHRAAYQAVQDADPIILGFQRVANPDACPFCKLLDKAYTKRADALPIHPHCQCGLFPLTEIHPRAVFLPDGTRVREHRGGELIDTPTPEGAAVHEHGEYGPTLVDPSHAFVGPLGLPQAA